MATITVTNTYTDAENNLLNGTVTFSPLLTATSDSVIIAADTVTARVVSGALSVNLLCTDSYAVDSGTISYRVYEKVGSTLRRIYYVVLPSTLGSTVVLSDLLQLTQPPGIVVIGGDPGVDQAALDAIDAEITALTARVNAISALDATQISVDASGGISGSNVQEALQALSDAVAALPSTDLVLE